MITCNSRKRRKKLGDMAYAQTAACDAAAEDFEAQFERATPNARVRFASCKRRVQE